MIYFRLVEASVGLNHWIHARRSLNKSECGQRHVRRVSHYLEVAFLESNVIFRRLRLFLKSSLGHVWLVSVHIGKVWHVLHELDASDRTLFILKSFRDADDVVKVRIEGFSGCSFALALDFSTLHGTAWTGVGEVALIVGFTFGWSDSIYEIGVCAPSAHSLTIDLTHHHWPHW